ncbi:hypothetical protein [Nocardia sp. NBC_01388]|uniref:hypothetical protein n=1 Tax=Nocardia sp. NBC_01388 TaxID=2903596 RepID=UPI0032479DD3
MKRPDTTQLRTVWRLIRIPTLLVALYLALRLILAALSQRHGFGSPDGMGLSYLTVAGLALALRIALLVIVPAVITYRIAAWAVTRVARWIEGGGFRRSGAGSKLLGHSRFTT